MKTFIIIISLLSFFFLLWLFSFSLWVQAVDSTLIMYKSKTRTAIGATFVRISDYTKKNGRLPLHLKDIDIYNNVHSVIIDDYWKKELVYIINPQKNIVTLLSYGKDGLVGGEGENADISKSYYYKKPDGTFWAGQDDWLSSDSLVKE